MEKMGFSCTSGSIENEAIRNRVIDVLEGTEPAFDLRKLKYYFDFINYKHDRYG